jgi:hypothetical protein
VEVKEKSEKPRQDKAFGDFKQFKKIGTTFTNKKEKKCYRQ